MANPPMKADEHLPNEPARVAGRYEERNVLGGLTGRVVYVADGEVLPPAPRGFTWRYVVVLKC
jgi:hypothetical protein